VKWDKIEEMLYRYPHYVLLAQARNGKQYALTGINLQGGMSNAQTALRVKETNGSVNVVPLKIISAITHDVIWEKADGL